MGKMRSADSILVGKAEGKRPLGRHWRRRENSVKMKMTVVWDVAPCSLVEIDRRFRGSFIGREGVDWINLA
jgi:hypothetical protein